MASSCQSLKSLYKDNRNGEWAAVKKIPGDSIDRDVMDASYENYRFLNHANVERIVARPLRQWDQMWHIPMEWVFGEKLEKMMFHPRRSSIQLTPLVTSKIITGMCEGLLYLHQNGYVHREISPANILVEGETFRSVIIGVFISRNQSNPQYLPPPETRRNPFDAESSDVWALGKVIFELLVGYQISRSDIYEQSIKNGLKGNIYRDPVLAMLDHSQTASMESVIGQIREAQYKVQETHSLSAQSSSMNALVTFSNSGTSIQTFSERFLQDLPRGFTLPNPLPPNHNLPFNCQMFDHRGRETAITGEIRTSGGRLRDAWWIKCEPNDSDDEFSFLE